MTVHGNSILSHPADATATIANTQIPDGKTVVAEFRSILVSTFTRLVSGGIFILEAGHFFISIKSAPGPI